MRAEQILHLLAVKHSKDVFVPECKDGPSQYTGHRRLDAWAMNRSWANALVTGYEIKVSRSDFVGDDKWRGYLPCCNAFYFVAAHGIIDPAELSAEAGLLVASKNAARLYTKKKAPHRDIVICEDVFRYVLMCRAKITAEYREAADATGYWRRWLAAKADKQEIGHRVSRRLRDLFSERVHKVERENRRLESVNASLADVKAVCEKLGLNPHGLWGAQTQVEQALKRINGGDIIRDLEAAEKALARARQALIGVVSRRLRDLFSKHGTNS